MAGLPELNQVPQEVLEGSFPVSPKPEISKDLQDYVIQEGQVEVRLNGGPVCYTRFSGVTRSGQEWRVDFALPAHNENILYSGLNGRRSTIEKELANKALKEPAGHNGHTAAAFFLIANWTEISRFLTPEQERYHTPVCFPEVVSQSVKQHAKQEPTTISRSDVAGTTDGGVAVFEIGRSQLEEERIIDDQEGFKKSVGKDFKKIKKTSTVKKHVRLMTTNPELVGASITGYVAKYRLGEHGKPNNITITTAELAEEFHDENVKMKKNGRITN